MNKYCHNSKKIKSLYNILFVHHAKNFSGAENSLLHLASHLDKKNFYPIFLCPGKGEFPRRLLEKKIAIIPHEFGKNREVFKSIKSLYKICKVIRSNQIRLIHSNGPQTNIPSGIAGRWSGVPVIWHARNLIKNEVIDLDKFAGFLPQRILCNSEAIRARFKNHRTGKIAQTIMNGVDVKDYDTTIISSAIKKDLGIPPIAKVVGMSSRLGKDKGHLTILKAMRNLKSKYPNLWMLIVGGNVFEEDASVPDFLKTKAHELGIEDKIIFTGFRTDVCRLYAAMDIFVLGTNAEPCGRVLFEAMAMKKPVVATNNGGTPEIVVDGETGFLYNYGDWKELAAKIHSLLSSENQMKKMGNAGRKRVEENFTIEINVKKTQSVYIDVFKEKNCLSD